MKERGELGKDNKKRKGKKKKKKYINLISKFPLEKGGGWLKYSWCTTGEVFSETKQRDNKYQKKKKKLRTEIW